MGKGGKRKNRPRSWKQATAGGTLVLKGRSFEKEYVVGPTEVEVKTPDELQVRTEEAIVEATKKQPQS